MDRAPFEIGEPVYDREDDDPDTAIVTNTPTIPAHDWDIPHLERTVAEDNPDYPDDAPIVMVLFETDIDGHFPDWDRETALTIDALLDADPTHYVFPHQRLARPDTNTDADGTDNVSTGETEIDPEPPAAVHALKDTLADRGMNAEIEADSHTVVAEKLGVTYRVQPGEVLDGDGPHRDKIEEIVAQA